MVGLEECQIPCLPRIAEGFARTEPQPLGNRIRRALAKPWNYHVKKRLKRVFRLLSDKTSKSSGSKVPSLEGKPNPIDLEFLSGDRIRVRSREEIQATLDRWKELKGCAFLEEMWQYAGTTQRVLVSMERFLDERDYRVKKCKGVVLLEGVICRGTPVFGRCDRCCHLFWRQEWLEKIDDQRA